MELSSTNWFSWSFFCLFDSCFLFSFGSTASTSPISWVVDGPRTTHHDFSVSFCEINLRMIIYNSSDAVAYVGVSTLDSPGGGVQSSDENPVASGNQAGWHSLSLTDDIKITSDVHGSDVAKPEPLPSVSPFIWSGTSSTRVQLEPMSSTEIPLLICVFSPGTYDLSNYALNWNLLHVNNEGNVGRTKQTSGTIPGYPYYLTVLQSEWDLGSIFPASFRPWQIEDFQCTNFCNIGL